MNKKIIIAITIITLISLVFILPPFLYNELEFKFRKELMSSFSSADKADAAFKLRKASVDDSVAAIEHGISIELHIINASLNILNAQKHNNDQSKLLPFIGKKYRKYHQDKIIAMDAYRKSTDEWLTRKQNEHLTTNTLRMISDTQQKIENFKDYDQWSTAIENLPETTQIIRENSQKLKESNFITKEIYDYYIEYSEYFEFMHQEAQKIATAQDSYKFDTEGLKEIFKNEINVDQIFADYRTKREESSTKQQEKYDQVRENLYKLNDFYYENSLGLDPISNLFSNFNPAYPRINYGNEKSNSEEVAANADLLGSGTSQQVYVTSSEEKTLIEVKDKGEIIASTEFEKGKIEEFIELSAVKLKTIDTKEYLHWVHNAGPHQFESLFFTIYEGQLVMMLGADMEEELWYAPFWTSRGTDILIKDIDQDGLKEVVEFVDEFPPNAPRLEDLEIKKITEEAFYDIDAEVTEKAWKIVSRENGGIGRGFRVVWNIYSFVDVEKPYLKKLNNLEFENMVKILLKNSPAYLGKITPAPVENQTFFTNPVEDLSDTISRTQLSQDSIEFNEFVREFWAGGFYSEAFGDHIPEQP